MYEIPSYITHYYNAGSDILKNVCSQPDEVAEEFLSSLKESGKRAWLHSSYLEERRKVEAWLYSEFVQKGKKPYLRNPLYFVLGICKAFCVRGKVLSVICLQIQWQDG